MKEKELEKVFKALANNRRLLILSTLKKKKELSVGELSKEIKLSFRATSRHVKVLYGASVVECEQRGTQIFYKVASTLPKIFKDMLGSL